MEQIAYINQSFIGLMQLSGLFLIAYSINPPGQSEHPDQRGRALLHLLHFPFAWVIVPVPVLLFLLLFHLPYQSIMLVYYAASNFACSLGARLATI